MRSADVTDTGITGQGSRIPVLDGLRGVAILLVLVWHFVPDIVQATWPSMLHATNSLLRFAWSGVDLFFVLSGFLIGGILIDNRESPAYFTTFYARRCCRIFPLYYVMTACFALLLYASWRPPMLLWLFERPLPVWSYLTFTQNVAAARAGMFGAQWLGPTWSLAIEEQFYILLSLVVRFTRRPALWMAFTLLAVMGPLTRVLLFFVDPQWLTSAYTLMPARADALMIGVLCALALRRPAGRAFARERRRLLYGVFAGLAAAIAGLALLHETVQSTRMVLAGYSVLALFYGVALALAVTAPDRELIGRVLRSPVLRRTGTLAYGLYLLHLPVYGLIALLPVPMIVTLVFGIAATFGVAWLSWTYFEKPIVDLGHHFRY